MKLADTIKLQNLNAAVAGTQATVADSRSADEWIKKFLDDKNKRLNALRQELHQLLDFPQPVEIDGAYREDKRSMFRQMPGRVAGHGKWAVVSPEGEIISRWDTEEEAKAAAWPAWKGILPSATGPAGGAKVKKLAAADIFEDPNLDDKTRARYFKHAKPQAVQDADILRMRDRRPSSHGQGSAGSGGAGAGGAGGGTGI